MSGCDSEYAMYLVCFPVGLVRNLGNLVGSGELSVGDRQPWILKRTMSHLPLATSDGYLLCVLAVVEHATKAD